MHALHLAPPLELLPRIHSLWDELADFQAADADRALDHLLRGVADMIRAQNAYWLGAVRVSEGDDEPMRGWRPRVVRHLYPAPEDQQFVKRAVRALAQGDAVDETAVTHARQAGSFRAPLLRELVSPAWIHSPFYEAGYVARGIVDVLWVIFPLNDNAEAYYGFQRKTPWGPFGESERAVAAYTIRGLKWSHRRFMLGHGLLVAQSPLLPAERRVLQLLLTEHTEKAIADQLGITPSTTHKYVSDIFRKFGVRGRAGLMAMWLGQAPVVSGRPSQQFEQI